MGRIANCGNVCEKIEKRYDKDHRFRDRNGLTQAGVMNKVSNVMLRGLLLVGIISALGAFGPMTTGIAAVGLGGGALLMQCAGGKSMKRKTDLFFTAVFAAGMVAVGGLGIAGTMSSVHVGYSLIGIIGAQAIFWGCSRVPSALHVINEKY